MAAGSNENSPCPEILEQSKETFVVRFFRRLWLALAVTQLGLCGWLSERRTNAQDNRQMRATSEFRALSWLWLVTQIATLSILRRLIQDNALMRQQARSDHAERRVKVSPLLWCYVHDRWLHCRVGGRFSCCKRLLVWVLALELDFLADLGVISACNKEEVAGSLLG